jgi:NAD-dependent dihydropyrimidine dehydrogenase PreA subunit
MFVELHTVYREGKIMAHYITDECISCGACAAECPVDAIHEGDGKYEIDPDTCIDCGACEAVCPTGAIKAE